MPLHAITPWLKRELRTCLTYSKTLTKGYPFRYASKQHPYQLDTYNHQWSEFVTPIPHRPGADVVNANRLWNLQLAAKTIDGLILKPQRIFGFWHRVPKPTLKNGFRAGPAFQRGKVTSDVGGGLCLISTNVFNALLLAGYDILERHNHSMDPYGERRFFPLGRDAMVYHGYRDLIARNPTEIATQLCLEVLPERGIVRTSIWGTAPCPFLIKLNASVVETFPSDAPEKMPGYIAHAQRWILPINASTAWVNDYTAVSHYEPCAAYYSSDKASAPQVVATATAGQ